MTLATEVTKAAGDPDDPWNYTARVAKAVSGESEEPAGPPPGTMVSEKSKVSDVDDDPEPWSTASWVAKVSDPWQGVPPALLQPALPPRVQPPASTETKEPEASQKSEVQEYQRPVPPPPVAPPPGIKMSTIDESEVSDATVLPAGLGVQVHEAESEVTQDQESRGPFERINFRLAVIEQQIMYLIDRMDYLISQLD